MHSRNPEIIKLSEMINQLPFDGDKPDEEKFRNPNGVGLKLCNFLALDPSYPGKGMGRHSELDAEVFNEFYSHREELRKVASEIKSKIVRSSPY